MIVNSIFVVIVVVIIITTIKQLVEFKAVVYYIPNHSLTSPRSRCRSKHDLIGLPKINVKCRSHHEDYD